MVIMIVDDHLDIRRVLKTILRVGYSNNLQFIECESGEEAVEKYATHQPDLVLMDIELGEMNGLEAAAFILNSDKNAKILIVTSHDSPSIRQKALRIPIQGFISKDDLSQVHHFISN